MESRRNLRVVPSNGPVLAESGNSPTEHLNVPTSLPTCPEFNNDIDCRVCGLRHACSTCFQEDHGSRACKKGILRVSSGNVGTSEVILSHAESKVVPARHYVTKESHALMKAPDHIAQAALKLEHRKRRRGLDSLSRLPLYYRSELQSPRYVAYRAKSRSKGPSQTWPDHVEEAFQQALRLYPRRGRKKLPLNGKPSGGNEFITQYILETLGVDRDRKQVSSHIQVLKGFMSDNTAWMSLVAANGFGPDEEDEKKHGIIKHEQLTARRTRMIPGTLEHTHATRSRYVSTLPPSPTETPDSNPYQYPTIRCADLSMILYERSTDNPIHTYTSMQCVMASASRSLDDVKDWRTFYPALAEYHDQGPVECPIFLFDTYFSLMDDFPGCSALLEVKNSLDFTQGVNYTDWESLTTFYERKGHLVDLAKFYEGSNTPEDPWRTLECNPIARTNDARVERLPLKSKWWAKAFGKMMEQNLKARATKDPQVIKAEEANTERYLRGISIMQEIYARPCARESKSHRLAILVWKFGKARRGDAGSTSWRRLVPPVHSAEVLVQSPDVQSLQSRPTLEDTLYGSAGERPAGPYADYYNPQQQPSIFADNAADLLEAPLSEGTSAATTPSLDYTSFPSSTTTSFPADALSSGFPPQPGQEACFESQGSIYPALASFDSQESQYSSQSIVSHSQEIYDSQDTMYQSHDTFYHPNPNQVYNWSTPHNLLADDIMASQDFTGGNIQILFPAPEEPAQTYETHLITPRANVAPQHQLIQHPEQFDHHDYLEPELQSQGRHEHIDWQLIESQPIQVPDLRFQNNELDDNDLREYEHYQPSLAAYDDRHEHSQIQGHVLGEVQKEVALEGRLKESP